VFLTSKLIVVGSFRNSEGSIFTIIFDYGIIRPISLIQVGGLRVPATLTNYIFDVAVIFDISITITDLSEQVM
jgi:hypothetical protein